jgi:hypothetical protein
MAPKTNTTEAPATEAKAKKVTARDQGVPEVYLSESGSFRPGYDAKLKSDLIVAILGDGRLYEFTADEAMSILESRGWLPMLETSREARERKQSKVS